MSGEGFITISRKLEEWQWADSPTMGWTLIRLLLRANYEPRKWHGIEVGRGQCVISVKDFGEMMGLTRQKMRTILERLEECNTIVTKSTNKYTIITICNYDSYQATPEYLQPSNNHQITNSQPSNNHQITTTELRELNKKTLSDGERKKGASAGVREGKQPPSSAAERPKAKPSGTVAEKTDGEASGTVAEAAGGVGTPAAEKTEVQKHIEAIRQERQEPDRSRYLRMLKMDNEWLAYCQLENNMLGVSLEPYMIVFWMRQTDEKKWRGYEDFRQHFCHWLKFINNGEVKEDYRKYKESKAKAEAAETRRQEQAKAEAEWAEHRKRSIPMPEEIWKRMMG